ncbi:MAG: metallophosphoesterase family protein [Oceanicaulis sp.]
MPLKRLLSRLTPGAPNRPAPPDHLIYAVGDVHGRADLLDELLSRIDADRRGEDAELIFLGDYVDRGGNSAVVLDMLIEERRKGRFATTFLKGNHEAVMLDFLVDAAAGPAWGRYGGLDTLLSYGVEPPQGGDRAQWETARRTFASVLPAIHREFLEGLELWAERGCYFFAHAGVNPHRPLADQSEADLIWIRGPFLDSERKLERIIVHGHSPEPEAHADERRIGVDTGAYATGVLTAAKLHAGRVTFVQTGPER